MSLYKVTNRVRIQKNILKVIKSNKIFNTYCDEKIMSLNSMNENYLSRYNFMNLVEKYEKIHFVDSSTIERTTKKSKNQKLKIIVFLIKNIFVINDDDKVNVKSQILI